MDSRITRLTPFQGVCAENAGSITLFMATGLGIPVSTTHTIPGSIINVGAARIGGLVEGGATNCYRLGDHNGGGGGKGALLYGGASLVR